MSVLASDNFNRADSANLGANWTTPSGLNSLPIAGNQVDRPSNIALDFYNAVTVPNDQWSQLVLKTVSTVSDDGQGPAIRITSGGDGYFLQCTTSESRIYKRVGGSFTQLGSDGPAFAANDIAYIEAQGTALVGKKNGSTIITATDSGISAGKFGIWGTPGSSQAGDDWQGGDFSGGGPQTVTPAPAVNTWTALAAFGANAVFAPPKPVMAIPMRPTGGGLTIGRPIRFSNDALRLQLVVSQIAINTWVSPAPAFSLGTVTVVPAPAIGTWVALSPITTVIALPAVAVNTWTALGATFSLGTATVVPTVAIATWSALAPTVSGSLTVNPAVAINVWHALDILLNGALVTPAAAVNTWTALAASRSVGAVSVVAPVAVHPWTALGPAVVLGTVTVAPTAPHGTWSALAPLADITVLPVAASNAWTARNPVLVLGTLQVVPTPAIRVWHANDLIVLGDIRGTITARIAPATHLASNINTPPVVTRIATTPAATRLTVAPFLTRDGYQIWTQLGVINLGSQRYTFGEASNRYRFFEITPGHYRLVDTVPVGGVFFDIDGNAVSIDLILTPRLSVVTVSNGSIRLR